MWGFRSGLINAFRNCSSIKSLSIPGNVLSIGGGSFIGCESLEDVKFCDGYQTLRTPSIPPDCPMVSLYLGRNIYTSGAPDFYPNEYYQGFFWSKTLESVTFGETISSINPLAFTDCDNLKEIHIPSNIKSIGTGAFSDCSNLISVDIDGPQCDIDWYAFYKCKSLITVKLNVADIGDKVIFEECSKLSKITLGRDVKTIGRGLDYCSKLQTLYCYAKNPPETNEYSFWEKYKDYWGQTQYGPYYRRVNLYVPEASISQYKAVEPWKSFNSINALFIPVDSIAFDTYEIKMEKMSNLKINCHIFPDDANNQELEWKSSDNLVVSVNDGKLIANEVGTAYVYAFSKDNPNAKDSCLVNVVVSTNGVTLSHNECLLSIGDSILLEATITPFDASNKKVYWSSSNESVCSVNNGLVTAKAKGTAIIMVTTEDGGYTAKCTFTVNQPVSGITLNRDYITFNNIGESFQLEATVLPEDASNKEVKWSSSNETICMVSQGKVIATGYGTAVVIASTVDGGFLASCVVKVEDTSAIRETIADTQDDYTIYDLMGCKVKKVIKGGLYIRNGQKFIAK